MQINILGYGDACRGMAALCAESIIRLGHPQERILVWSDQCDWFRRKGYRVRELSQATIEDWKGPYGFALRLKILMMREIFATAPSEAQLFSDADIYWKKLPDASILEKGTTALMHAREPDFNATMMDQYNRAVSEVYPGEPFQMHNSGVLGFPSGFPAAEFDTILRACDHICDLLPRKLGLAEQVAYTASFVRKYDIRMIGEDAYHYWTYNEEVARLMQGRDLDDWASLSFEQLTNLNGQADELFHSPIYRWQNRFRKLKRSWKKTKHEWLARQRRAQHTKGHLPN